jgi:hypothetical protein
MSISPKLTLTVDKTVASPGETITLSGSLDIPEDQGDLIKDNAIDMRDIIMALRAFGSTPGAPNWNPNADLNKDGKVDIKDLILIVRLFGQTSGGKNIILYVSSDGVNWSPIAQVTTLGGRPAGSFVFTDTIPTETPTPSTRYYMAYFPGGVYGGY